MIFRLAKNNELNKVLELYHSVLDSKYCVWNEKYPGMLEINYDFETNNLFVIEENEQVVGAVSIVPENEMDIFSEWKIKENVKEIARVVVAKECQRKGIGFLLVSNIINELKRRKVSAVHLAVALKNEPAFKIYQKLGFKIAGTKDMYNSTYYLCELKLNGDKND